MTELGAKASFLTQVNLVGHLIFLDFPWYETRRDADDESREPKKEEVDVGREVLQQKCADNTRD